MGCFGTKAYGMPKGHPLSWSKKDVKQFLKHSELTEYTKVFTHVDGKALMTCDMNMLEDMIGTYACSAVLPAVNDLRSKWSTPVLHTQGTCSETATVPGPIEKPVMAESTPEVETVEDSHAGTRGLVSSRPTQESVAEGGRVIVIPLPHQGPHEWSEKLAPFAGAGQEAVYEYLLGLGKGVGAGLTEAVDMEPAVGKVFGAAFSLNVKARGSRVNRENCYKAAGLGQDVLRILDSAWRRNTSAGFTPCEGSFLRPEGMMSLAVALAAMSDLAEPFTRTGCLLHIVCNDRLKESFDNGHNAVVDTLQEEGLATLPGGRSLGQGDYRDIARSARRLVRQHGSGSVTKGLHTIKAQAVSDGVEGEAVCDLGAVLEMGSDELGVLVEELEAVPSDVDIDLDVYYANLTGRSIDEESSAVVFDYYDRNCDGVIDVVEFHLVLQDLGLLEGKSDADAFVVNSFRAADKTGSGGLNRELFGAVYATLATSHARQQLRTRMGLHVEEELRAVFASFAAFGVRNEVDDIDNVRFVKLTKDCNLLDDKLTSVDVDLIFAKIKTIGARRMNFDQFLSALSLCADKKGVSFEDMVRSIVLTGAPIARATRPDNVRLHDDKSTYTGVYAKGGPRAVDAPKNDLSSLVDRNVDTDVRGVQKTPAAKMPPPSKVAALYARKPHMASPSPVPRDTRLSMGGAAQLLHIQSTGGYATPDRRRTTLGGGAGGNELLAMFTSFSTFGGGASMGGAAPAHVEMDSSKFVKLCRECKLMDGKFNTTRADLVFTTITRGHKEKHRAQRLNFDDFQEALRAVAIEKGMSMEEVCAAVTNSDGPLLTRARG